MRPLHKNVAFPIGEESFHSPVDYMRRITRQQPILNPMYFAKSMGYISDILGFN